MKGMGGGGYVARTPEDETVTAIDRLIRWVGYVQTSAKQDTAALPSDYAEVCGIVKLIGHRITQHGKGTAGRRRVVGDSNG